MIFPLLDYDDVSLSQRDIFCTEKLKQSRCYKRFNISMAQSFTFNNQYYYNVDF